MACDRFSFSSTGTSAPRSRNVRRTSAADTQIAHAPALSPVSRNRLARFDFERPLVMTSQLAAAAARIAELEAALSEACEIASHDPLTSALNRRGMNEAFARESARAKRSGQPLALALIDLDDFKQINDQYGHAVGDAALVHLTKMIAETLRPTDSCCRLGGEEFVLLMPGSDRAAAKKAVARLLAALAAKPLAGTAVTLFFSAGVVAGHEAESLDAMLERADKAVYRAKAAGKHRVLSA